MSFIIYCQYQKQLSCQCLIKTLYIRSHLSRNEISLKRDHSILRQKNRNNLEIIAIKFQSCCFRKLQFEIYAAFTFIIILIFTSASVRLIDLSRKCRPVLFLL